MLASSAMPSVTAFPAESDSRSRHWQSPPKYRERGTFGRANYFAGMSQLTRHVHLDRLLPFPQPVDAHGRPRKVGIEIEFGGLTEEAAARVAQACLGGRVAQVSRHEWRVTGSDMGQLKIYLDTAFRNASTAVARLGADLARNIVPVEIVTEPLSRDQLGTVDAFRTALRDAGATGTRDGWGHGFGLHLNPATTGATVAYILPMVRAFALMEDWLRHADPIDVTRRVLPFAHPYPRHFIDEITEHGETWTLGTLWSSYLRRNATRNRGLDLLPLIAELAPESLDPLRPRLGKVSARRAFHYRLPDSRLDEADWSVTYEFNRWVMVERVAADRALSARLAEDWLAHRAALTTIRRNWHKHVEHVLRDHDVAGAEWTVP